MNTSTNVPNRLINEKSPYLLQHAYNPVDWFPWGTEAFEKAKAEDKPIFLSIGYSCCHWCHVMERESFEDIEVAEVLNKSYISIKVDREERPDIDSIYMAVCQVLTGSGGWPLTIIMTPDKKPFFAGTYFPKHSKYGRPGLIDMLNTVSEAWINKKDELLTTSNEIIKAVHKSTSSSNKGNIGMATIDTAYNGFQHLFDPSYGGFGSAPKFPTPHNLSFLLRNWMITKNQAILEIVEKTLESMYKGGIFDHIGFGFSRYSTDRKWLVPHFEKMLYDNALLAIAYIEAYQATNKSLYKDVADKIFSYILRDMTSTEGGFYSAEDADSEGEEGKFYVWTVDEIKTVLGDDDAKLFCNYYDISKSGNFESKNIPNLISADLKEMQNNLSIASKLESIRQKLFIYREGRIHPYKDDKILTSWNGLMIAALSYGGRVFSNKLYIDAAEKAADFIINNLVRTDGRLMARYRDGQSAYPGYLDDYCFIVWGLIELYETTFNINYLKKALEFTKSMLELFWDNTDGGLFIYGKDSEELILRPKDIYDGAIPSGNSVAALNMLRLSRIIGDEYLESKAKEIISTFGGDINENPNSYSQFLIALLFSIIPTKEIVIAGEKDSEDTLKMLKEINSRFIPFSTVILNNGNKELYNMISYIESQKRINARATAYVCEDMACNEPTDEIDKFIKLLL